MRKSSSVALLIVLAISMFASTYLVSNVSAKKPKNEFEYWWDVYLDYTDWWLSGGTVPPTIMDVESNLEWIEELDYTTPFYAWGEIVGDELVVHYFVDDIPLVKDYKVQGSFDYYFEIHWKLPLEYPFWGTDNWGFQWFEDGKGYFEGIEGNGEVWVDLYELEMPPEDGIWKFYTVQHSWGTINIGDLE